jgi:endonuclease YncB( thermonuclease family)
MNCHPSRGQSFALLQRMRRLGRRTLLTLASAATLLGATPTLIEVPTQERSDPVQVRRVINGTTIDVVGVGRVRLLGIQIPTSTGGAHKASGAEAALRLSGLLANRWVRLEFESGLRGAAYVFLDDGRFVNEWLVREGFARVSSSTGRSRLRRVDELLAAESAARAGRRGFWRDERIR